MNENHFVFVYVRIMYVFTMSTIYRLPILNFNLRTIPELSDFQDIEQRAEQVCVCAARATALNPM